LRIVNSDIHHLHFAPLVGVTQFKFHQDLWQHTTKVPVLLYGLVCMMLCLAVLVQLQLVTDSDGRTDGETWPQHILCQQSVFTTTAIISNTFKWAKPALWLCSSDAL